MAAIREQGRAQLWPAHGKAEEAHQKLTEIYGWFSEGFNTPALADARDLLDSLREMLAEPAFGAE